jgi:hypothetical protein
VITENRTLLNTDKAEKLIYIHDNYWDIEKTIKNWKIRPDRERGRDRSNPHESAEEIFSDPQPGSSQSQSQSQTPSAKTPRQRPNPASFRTPKSIRKPPDIQTLLTPLLSYPQIQILIRFHYFSFHFKFQYSCVNLWKRLSSLKD